MAKYKDLHNNADIEDNSRTELALLFESFCEYPRIIGQFTPKEEIDYRKFSPLSDKFKYGSSKNKPFAYSIRFRNYMRYGVSSALVNDGEDNFKILLKQTGNSSSWNHGVFLSNSQNNYIKKFEKSRDDGLAILREPGAFLSPNHFQYEDKFETFSSFCGANIIMTSELLQELFVSNKKIDAQCQHRNLIASGTLIKDFLDGMHNNFLEEIMKTITEVQTDWMRSLIKSRISLTALFQKHGLLQKIQEYSKSEYKHKFKNLDMFWTWSYEKLSSQEIWCHAKDYRVGSFSDKSDDITTKTFPDFQVGEKAIPYWVDNLDNNLADAGTTCPSFDAKGNNVDNLIRIVDSAQDGRGGRMPQAAFRLEVLWFSWWAGHKRPQAPSAHPEAEPRQGHRRLQRGRLPAALPPD
jgi:hypothetical protein